MRREYASDRFFQRGQSRTVRTRAEWIRYYRELFDCTTEHAEDHVRGMVRNRALLPVGEPA